MTITHLLTLDPTTGADVRMPFDLETLFEDWEHAEPYHEPPLCAPLTRRSWTFAMLCDRCRRSVKRQRVGRCKCGGWMKRR